MEKLKKSEKDLSFTLDLRKIPSGGLNIKFSASSEELQKLANRFDLLRVKSFTSNVRLTLKDDLTVMDGSFQAIAVQTCVVTCETFDSDVSGHFHLLLSFEKQPDILEECIDITEEPVEYCPNGIIPFRELLGEQFGLNLNPFPHKINQPFEYRESVSKTENPFFVLKGLTKPKKSV